MRSQVLRFAGWTVGALIACVLLAYVAMLAINWRDQPPSETAARFATMHRKRPAVPDDENAALFVLGVGAAPDADVSAVGKQRDEWLRAQNEADVFDPKTDPLRDSYEPNARSERVKAFIASCRPNEGPCRDVFVDAASIYSEWIAAEPWLLSRYEQLLAHEGWVETVPVHIAAPLPSYARVMEGQKLLLLKAKVLADEGRFADARQLLESDFRFWRRVLPATDILISKMIAAVALNRNLELGNLILREIPSNVMTEIAPSQWFDAFDDETRSMERVLVGEWTFSSGILRTLAEGFREEDSTLYHLRSSMFTAPFYQPQATLNRSADKYAQAIALFQVPITRYSQAVARSKELAKPAAAGVPFKLYNPVGNWVIGMGFVDVSTYAARVADLEGTRRATLAAIEARAKQVKDAAMPEALMRSEQRNPYDDQPFGWDPERTEIVFRGLEEGARGDHRIRY